MQRILSVWPDLLTHQPLPLAFSLTFRSSEKWFALVPNPVTPKAKWWHLELNAIRVALARLVMVSWNNTARRNGQQPIKVRLERELTPRVVMVSIPSGRRRVAERRLRLESGLLQPTTTGDREDSL